MRPGCIKVLCVLTLVFAACSGDSGDDKPLAGAVVTDPTSSVEARGSDDTTDDADPEKRLRASENLPEDKALDVELRHPNGTTVTLTKLTFGPTSIVVDLEVVNGSTKMIRLNARGVHLADDLGNGYNFVEPKTNPELQIEQGGTLTGSLAFLGPLVADAKSVTLLLNTFDHTDNVDLAAEFDKATNPAFEFSDIVLER